MKSKLMKMILGAVVLSGVAFAAYGTGAASKPEDAKQLPINEIKWQSVPGAQMESAILWGDRDKGPDYGMLLKWQPGYQAGMHAHTNDYYALTIQGTWVHTVKGDPGSKKELPSGSYVFQPGGQMHDDFCTGTQECIIFVHMHGKGDAIRDPGPSTPTAPTTN